MDIALKLLELSREAYYDQLEYTTPSSFGPCDIDQCGLTLFDHHYDHASDTYCYLAYNAEKNKLYVAFR